MSLRLRFILVVLTLLAAVIAVGAVGQVSLNQSGQARRHIVDHDLKPALVYAELIRANLRMRAALLELLLDDKVIDARDAAAQFDDNSALLSDSLKALRALKAAGSVDDAANSLAETMEAARKGMLAVRAAIDAKRWAPARDAYREQVGPRFVSIRDQQSKILQDEKAQSAQAEREAAEQVQSASTRIYGVLTAALLVALGGGGYLVLSILRPVGRIQATLAALQAGQGDARVRLAGRDELSRIGTAVDALADTLAVTAQRETDAAAALAALAQRLSADVQQMVAVADQAAQGKLNVAVPATQDAGTAALADGLRHMIGGLGTLITSLQGGAIQIRSAVNQLNAAALENDEMGAAQAAGSTEIAASSAEITQTARELAATMAEVTRSAEGAAALADEGQGSLNSLDASLAQIAAASTAIVGKFSTLNERAGNIGAVVTTITRVADQTNLLSLNAAIEAEKAGEYGQGFSVIATEIRRLADQTAVAAGDIVQIVGEMQGAVSASVMSMDKFNEEVGRNIGGVRELSKILQRVIETVHQLAPRFESVNQGMQMQSQVAEQINVAIRGFSQGAAKTAQLLQNTRTTTQNLDGVAAGLQSQIQRFELA